MRNRFIGPAALLCPIRKFIPIPCMFDSNPQSAIVILKQIQLTFDQALQKQYSQKFPPRLTKETNTTVSDIINNGCFTR